MSKHLKLRPIEGRSLLDTITRRRNSTIDGPGPGLPLHLSLTRQTILNHLSINLYTNRYWQYTYIYLHIPTYTYIYLSAIEWWRAFHTQHKMAGHCLMSCCKSMEHGIPSESSRVQPSRPILEISVHQPVPRPNRAWNALLP